LLIGLLLSSLALAGCETRQPDLTAGDALPAASPATVDTPAVVQAQPIADPQSEVLPSSPLTAPEIYYGRDGSPETESPGPPITIAEGGDVTLNFVDAEIRDFVDVVLGQTLGVTYVIDPRVVGTVTMRTARPVPREAAIGVLEDVLAINGAALIQISDTYKIVPLDEAVSAPAVVHDGGALRLDRGFSLHVIPLRFASAETLRAAVEPFVPPGRTLRVDPARNLFIFAGTGTEADDFVDLISIFDVDWMADRSFGLFPLKYASAQSVANELEHVFYRAGEAETGIIDFVPIERLNAILVITPQESYLDDARAWIDRLDRGIEADQRQLYVYFLQNGRAAELAVVLASALAVTTVDTRLSMSEGRVAPGLTPTEMSQLAETGQPADLGEAMTQDGASLYGSNAPFGQSAGAAIPNLGAGTDGLSLDGSGKEETARIVADARNNALLIYATASEYQIIGAALRKLDIVPLQVLIEATIAEVTLNDALKYGLEWFFNIGDSNLILRTAEPPVSTPTPTPNLILSQFPGFSYLLATSDVKVVLNALSQITDVKVISSPQLMVLDNEPARLQVGDQVPIAVRSSVSVTDPEAPVVNEIEYRDTGVILDIIPRVNASGLVVLDIIQEVSDVVVRPGITVSTTTVTPTIAQRRIASTVAINSGETVALGGLIRDNTTNAVSGIPWVSDIPLLGNLFKTTSESVQRTELLILLTPRVVRDRQDARTVTDELRSRLRALTQLRQRID